MRCLSFLLGLALTSLFGCVAYIPTKDYYKSGNLRHFYVKDSILILYFENGKTSQVSYYTKGDKPTQVVFFLKDDGDTSFIYHYYKGRSIGFDRAFFTKNRLKSMFEFSNDSVIGAKAYDLDGNEIEATKVENGNGQVIFCSEDGKYCCRCEVKNYKLINCGSLDAYMKKVAKRNNRKKK